MGEIISVSRRSDIPAFHWDWFTSVLKMGRVDVKNPFSNRTYTVSLLPGDVDCFVFWTKDPSRAAAGIERVRKIGYDLAIHVTINGYGIPLEKNVPPWEVSAGKVRELSAILGKNRVFWRFDPLFPFEDEGTMLGRFRSIAGLISHHVSRCYVATFSPYLKATRRMEREMHPPRGTHRKGALRALLLAGREYGLSMRSCSSPALEDAGFEKGACIDGEYLSATFGNEALKKKKKGTRPGCGCTDSRDIGAYGTCMHRCIYCYAS